MINKYTSAIFLMFISLMNSPAYAKFQKAESMFKKVQGGLIDLSRVTVVVAIIWAGYKILFGGSTLREMAPILIGAVVIGGAVEIGALLTAR